MDNFTDHESSLGSPAGGISSITPNDAVDLASATRGLNVSVGGFVRVTTVSGEIGTLYVAPGIAFPIRVIRVWATGTDATDIKGLH